MAEPRGSQAPPGAGRKVALRYRAVTLPGMSDFERAQLEFIESLMAFDRAAEASPRAERVLPSDVDLDAELAAAFAELSR